MSNMNIEKLENETLLIIAPHADDEVLGCCGLINKIKNDGGKVYVQILTMGGYTSSLGKKITKTNWKKELAESMKKLDIDGYDILFYKDKLKNIDTTPLVSIFNHIETKSKVSMAKTKPTIVAIPTIFSSNQDHIQAYKAAITSLRPHSQKTNYLPKLVISYESPEYYFWSAYSEFGKFSPNFYLQMSEIEIKKKSIALNIYKSQLHIGKRDEDKIRALATIRGSEIGVKFAEAFHIHRLQF